jgi:diaminohydroxyphosphoribosylaminopyrimidine deaminase / 5-amino-6-(5-phosphoribosylamino)uracil reductase
LPASAKCLAPGARRIVIGDVPPAAEGVEHMRVKPVAGVIAPSDILSALRGAGLRRVLIEGGGTTVSRFLEAKVLDRLHIMVAPMVIGAGPVGLSFGAARRLADAARPGVSVYPLPGGDVLFDCAFRSKE